MCITHVYSGSVKYPLFMFRRAALPSYYLILSYPILSSGNHVFRWFYWYNVHIWTTMSLEITLLFEYYYSLLDVRSSFTLACGNKSSLFHRNINL